MASGFSHEEYAARCQRARSLMEDKRLDTLLVTDDANLYYFTGYTLGAEGSFPRPSVFILPLEHNPVLIVHDAYKTMASKVSWLEDVRGYSKLAEVPVEMVRTAFGEVGCTQGHVGAELGHEQHLAISHNDFVRLRDALPQVEFVDASDVLWGLRMVKSEAEIAAMAKACEITDAVLKHCFETVEVGLTQGQIVNLIRRAVADSGADFGFATSCFGPNNPWHPSEDLSADPVLQEGDLFWVDMGVVWNGYHTDYCRAAVPGKPSAEQVQVWEGVHRMAMAAEEAVRPGIRVSELARVQNKVADMLDLDPTTCPFGRSGHGIGLHMTEPPYVNLCDNTILEPGMTITIEPGVMRNDGVYVYEDNLVVTDTGCTMLSHAPWELRAI